MGLHARTAGGSGAKMEHLRNRTAWSPQSRRASITIRRKGEGLKTGATEGWSSWVHGRKHVVVFAFLFPLGISQIFGESYASKTRAAWQSQSQCSAHSLHRIPDRNMTPLEGRYSGWAQWIARAEPGQEPGRRRDLDPWAGCCGAVVAAASPSLINCTTGNKSNPASDSGRCCCFCCFCCSCCLRRCQ